MSKGIVSKPGHSGAMFADHGHPKDCTCDVCFSCHIQRFEFETLQRKFSRMREEVEMLNGVLRHTQFLDGQHQAERDALRDVARNLLMSADCSWEEHNEGHDWANACESARKVLNDIE